MRLDESASFVKWSPLEQGEDCFFIQIMSIDTPLPSSELIADAHWPQAKLLARVSSVHCQITQHTAFSADTQVCTLSTLEQRSLLSLLILSALFI